MAKGRNSVERTVKRKAKSAVKKTVKKNIISVVFIVVFFAVALVGGHLAYKNFTSEDTFKLKGEEEINFGANAYVEYGVEVIGFNKDLTKYVKVSVYDMDGDFLFDMSDTKTINPDEKGEYQVVYSLKSVDEVSKDTKLSLFEKLALKKYSDYSVVRNVSIGGV